MTWQELYTKAQTIAGDASTATLTQLKQDMNLGNKRVNAAMNNYFNRRSKSASLVADQQYYQLPPDCIRVTGVDYLQTTTRRLPIEQLRSEYQWRMLNANSNSGSILVYWFQKGADEIGLYPIPSTAVTNGLIIYYEPKGFLFSQDDYSTGTVTVTNGSPTITGSGTTFTSSMANREFRITDGSDGYDYRIASYTSTTVLTLEEPYVGISGSGKTYLIGEAPLYPSEYHDAPVDYALMRFFELNNNPDRASYHKAKFDQIIQEARDRYASSSSSMVITDAPLGYNPWQDNTKSIVES